MKRGSGPDCRSGERIDWTAKGVPSGLECYLHRDLYPGGPYVAIWDGARHLMVPENIEPEVLAVGLRGLIRP